MFLPIPTSLLLFLLLDLTPTTLALIPHQPHHAQSPTKVLAARAAQTTQPLANTPVPTRKAQCATGVHVVAASGQGSENIGGYGLLGSQANDVVGNITGSTQVALTFVKDDPSYQSMFDVGANNLVAYLQQYHAACPNTKIALMGYSAGAIIIGNTLCGPFSIWDAPSPPLSTSFLSTITSITLYGDETFVAGQSWNRGTCTAGKGESARKDPSTCDAWASKMRSWCLVDDPKCCQGDVDDAHYEYADLYDGRAVGFAVRRWKRSQTQT